MSIDNSIDLVVTSPPYNMRTRIRNGEYTTRERSEHFSKKYEHFSDDLSIEEYYEFHKNVLTELLRVSKCVLWNYQIVTGSKEAVFKLIGDFADKIKDIIIWEKVGQPAMHEQVLNSCYEFIIVFENDNKKGRCITNSQFKRGTMNNVLKGYKKNNNIKGHGACFPVELVKDLVNAFSKEGDIVLDPFMGSGSTVIAAKQNSRNGIGIDMEMDYCQLAMERILRETK